MLLQSIHLNSLISEAILVQFHGQSRLLAQRIKARLADNWDRLPEILAPKWMVTFQWEQRPMEAPWVTQIRVGGLRRRQGREVRLDWGCGANLIDRDGKYKMVFLQDQWKRSWLRFRLDISSCSCHKTADMLNWSPKYSNVIRSDSRFWLLAVLI